MLSNREKRHLAEQIGSLGNTEHLEILKIIRQYSINHSENNNGVFFNMTSLTDDIIEKIHDFVRYCYDNKHTLDEYDRKLHECKYSNDISTMMSGHVFESSIKNPLRDVDRVHELLEHTDRTEKVKEFIDLIQMYNDKSVIKRTNTKYAMAKKKFCRRNIVDTSELNDELDEEGYE